jgi:hypothetical protein
MINFNDIRPFEDEEVEPMMFTHLKAEGYVGNRPPDFDEDEIHEDDTWTIDQYDEDGDIIVGWFLYVSEFEYLFLNCVSNSSINISICLFLLRNLFEREFFKFVKHDDELLSL